MSSKDTKHLVISVDTKTMVKTIVLVVSTMLALVFLKDIAHALVLIFVSIFLAMGLNPAVSWIAVKLKSASRVRATAVAYIIVLTVLVGFFSLVIPPLVRQTVDFIKDVPQTIQDVKTGDSSLSQFVNRYKLDNKLDKISSDFAKKFDVGEPALSAAGAIGSTLANIIVVLVLTFMMLVEGPLWLQRFWTLTPANKRKERREIANRMYRSVTGYVNGQVLIAFIGGGFAIVALAITRTIFNAPINPVALGAIITLFALLPLIGTTIGASIVCLACLVVSVPLAATMAIYFIVYQQIENATIQPYIQAKTNSLTPLIVFVAALIGVSFAGILGAFAAIPTAGCIKIFIEERYETQLKKIQDPADKY
jgi:predicted PurR-regulated permease PerM